MLCFGCCAFLHVAVDRTSFILYIVQIIFNAIACSRASVVYSLLRPCDDCAFSCVLCIHTIKRDFIYFKLIVPTSHGNIHHVLLFIASAMQHWDLSL